MVVLGDILRDFSYSRHILSSIVEKYPKFLLVVGPITPASVVTTFYSLFIQTQEEPKVSSWQS